MGALLAKSSGHNKRDRSRRRRTAKSALVSEINVTPMVDVMLVLLVIFMVTAPMLTATIPVDLPVTSSEPKNSDEKPVEVTIKTDHSLYIGNDKVTEGMLIPQLKTAVADKSTGMQTRIFVRGDKAVDYGSVVKIIDTIKNAGFSKIGIRTEVK
jgi:biopolymer transport protein TolR